MPVVEVFDVDLSLGVSLLVCSSLLEGVRTVMTADSPM
jgi:hypothetical protein